MQQRVAVSIISHPDYTSPDPINNDIAIIHVNQPFRFTDHVRNVCLYSGTQKVLTTGCFASGWGTESYSSHKLSQILKKVKMDQVEHDVCEKKLADALENESFNLSNGFLCAGGNENDLCIGDSGAPLVCPVEGEENKFVLTGIASYGLKCFTETPGIYTNVAKYFDWVQGELKNKV